MNKLVALLSSRPVLFAAMQALVALAAGAWAASPKYWILTATLTNGVSIVILQLLLRQEGSGLVSLWRLDRRRWKGDLAIFAALIVISLPVILAPSLTLSTWLWGSPEYYHQVLFEPIPRALAWVLVMGFPVSTALAEYATYFGYALPRLRRKVNPQWIAWVVVAVFFSLQHCALPLLFEAKFVLFRGVMYLPFALLISALSYRRPSLLPYLMVLNGLLNALPVLTSLSR